MISVSRPSKTISPQVTRTSRTVSVTLAQAARPQLAKTIIRPVKQVSVAVQPRSDARLDELADDTTPQLGGPLDLNGFGIYGTLDTGLVLDGGLIDNR